MESCRRYGKGKDEGKVLGKPHKNTGTATLVLELRIGMDRITAQLLYPG
jgi:hypothetical protein